jgi:putative NIF3 family GTP cyclohydrolase 1 type 2
MISRRKFVSTSLALGGASLLSIPSLADIHKDELTIQQVIDLIWKAVPGAPFGETVDTIKAGNANQKVTGIVTTMFATVDVIRKAIELKANFIIAHEPTFYNHLDRSDWLESDPVYKFKRDLIEKNNLVVWRFHDGIHTLRPDGVLFGFIQKMGWESNYNTTSPWMVDVPAAITVRQVVEKAKKGFGIKTLRIVGDLEQSCKRIAMIPGAAGGRAQISMIRDQKPDLFLCGEVAEWETSEYIRDARSMGNKVSLIILGHVQSEEPGMQWLVPWLQPKVPGIKITHVPAESPFTYL